VLLKHIESLDLTIFTIECDSVFVGKGQYTVPPSTLWEVMVTASRAGEEPASPEPTRPEDYIMQKKRILHASEHRGVIAIHLLKAQRNEKPRKCVDEWKRV
jgi:hypothetical protein